MIPYLLFGFILLLIICLVLVNGTQTPFADYIAPYAQKSQKDWWKRDGWRRFGYPYYSFWEGFENRNDRPASIEQDASLLKQKVENESSVLEYPPESPGPASLYNNNPYHLLADEMAPPRVQESLSCVNSRSCYASDFERTVSKTGTYRQMTNNYKRGYPDSCTAPFQELVLNFYQANPIPLASNNTGKSVSEATGVSRTY